MTERENWERLRAELEATVATQSDVIRELQVQNMMLSRQLTEAELFLSPDRIYEASH